MQSTKSSVSEMPFGDDEKPFEHQPKAGYNIKGSHFKFFLKNVHQMSNYFNRMHYFHHISSCRKSRDKQQVPSEPRQSLQGARYLHVWREG